MSLYDDASLIVYPSGYKSGVIYSQKPTDGSGDLTFTRASTKTRINESGVLETIASGVPPLDYTGGGCGKFLFEPQRTNNLLQSNQFDTTWLNQLGGTIVGGQTNTIATSDDAWKLTKDAASGRSIRQIIALGSNTYTYSAFLKAGTLTTASLRVDTSSGASIINVDLSLGTITSEGGTTGSSVVDYGGGWYRYSMTIADTVSNVHVYAGVIADTDAGDIFCQRTQLEPGSYATSYMPTAGATATRIADASTTTGLSALINSPAGVFNFIATPLGGSSSVQINDGSVNNRVRVDFLDTGFIRFIFTLAGANQVLDITTPFTYGTEYKIAVNYGANDYRAYVNGVKEVEDLTVSPIPASTMNQLQYETTNGAAYFSPTMLFPTTKTDASLIDLTTP